MHCLVYIFLIVCNIHIMLPPSIYGSVLVQDAMF